MKRLVLILTLALSLSSLTSLANNIEVSKPVLESFQNSFRNATNVTWSNFENGFKVNFTLNDQVVCAYYNEEGKMIALTRNINSRNLPFALQVSLKKEYASYWITDLMEISNDQGTYYIVTVENADTRMILKSSLDNEWNFFRKSSK